jgi:phosphatidylinositol alpha-1,6-mannosyltransferase
MELHGFESSRISEGAYCLDVDTLSASINEIKPQRSNLRRQLGIDDSIVFLMVAGFTAKRAYPLLLLAFVSVVTQYRNAVLLIVGDGPEDASVRQMAARLGLQGSVRFLGSVPFDKLTEIYVVSDVYVHSSITEAYSLAVIHAAVAGLPVISSEAVGAAYDIVLQDQTGYWATAGSTSSLESAMREAIEHAPLLPEMGARAHALAMQKNIAWAANQFEQCVETAQR